MANKAHADLILQGVVAWNGWRREEAANIRPDLSGIDLKGSNLREADLRGVDLSKANLSTANLEQADLSGADLSRTFLNGANLEDAKLSGTTLHEANLTNAIVCDANLNRANLSRAGLVKTDLRAAKLDEADLSDADLFKAYLTNARLIGAKLNRANLVGAVLSGANLDNAKLCSATLCGVDLTMAGLRRADLSYANLSEADLGQADLSGANLSGADLTRATLIETNVESADLTGCRIYGVSAWNLIVNDSTRQTDLLISSPKEPDVTVSDIEVAQFVYLLLNRKKLRNVLQTITSKAVLLLGRFVPERKAVLDSLASELRKHNLLPIIFDFERSTNRDFTETIKILAGLSLFVIVDITKPKSAPQELTAIIPDYQIPFVPLLEEGEVAYSMFTDFQKYDWVLKPILIYRTKEVLLEHFKNAILERAWNKHLELQRKRTEALQTCPIEDVLDGRENS